MKKIFLVLIALCFVSAYAEEKKPINMTKKQVGLFKDLVKGSQELTKKIKEKKR